MRASDADRDEVRTGLRLAHAEGRLNQDELTDCAGAALAARTVGDLTPLTADLPPAGPAAAGERHPGLGRGVWGPRRCSSLVVAA